MNDPLGRIEALEQEQKQLKEHQREQDERLARVEQATEPVKVTRIELDPGGIQNRLDNHAEMMRELSQQSDLHTQAFVRVEVILKEHTARIGSLETKVDNGFQAMQKRFDAIAEVQRLILERLPEKE